MAEPLAFFITWGTYGSRLPGDERGWIKRGQGVQPDDFAREFEAAISMTEDACRLNGSQRLVVELQIAETCAHRAWHLHAVNCRTNHAHVVVTATN